MNNFMKYIKMVLVILLMITIGRSQLAMTPRSMAFAGANATQARGTEVIGWNPANLGLADNPKFSLRFGVLPLFPFPNMQFGNNSLSPYWFNNRFFTGALLDDQDKSDLLSYFPDEGLFISPLVQMDFLSLSFGRWAVSLGAEMVGNITIPKPLFHFLFYGNKFGEPIDLSTMNLEFQMVNSLTLYHGRTLQMPYLSDYVDRIAVGGGLKFLGGGFRTTTEKFDASITMENDRIILEGASIAQAAAGGYGFALDLGMAADINQKMHANVALMNLFGVINWGGFGLNLFDDGDVLIYEFDYESQITSDQFLDADMDSILNEGIQVDTSYSTSGFTHGYPSYLVAGFQYDVLPFLSLYANYKQFFKKQLVFNTVPQLSLATKFDYLKWLPVRIGVAVGGRDEFRWGFGTGLNFKHYHLDFGFSQVGGMFNHAKGFAFSLGQTIIF